MNAIEKVFGQYSSFKHPVKTSEGQEGEFPKNNYDAIEDGTGIAKKIIKHCHVFL
jgi:hypothetical protein